MSRIYAVLLFVCMAIIISCGGIAKHTGPIITMVADTGGVNDHSFNQGAWEGLQFLAKENPKIGVSYFESKTEADYVPMLQNAVDNGAILTWAIGYTMEASLREISAANPEAYFAIVDYGYEPALPNVAGVYFRVGEASYLAGYLSAKMSQTKKIGFIGAFETPIIDNFEYGFRAGVIAADPSVQVFTQYTASFSDSDKGKSIAQTMADSDIDIIFPVAGDAGNGAIELARERNLYVIGVDKDQSYLAPKQMLTSVLKRVDNATYVVSLELLNGEFTSGTHVLGLADGAVGLAPLNTALVTDKQLVSKLEELKEQIIAGEIVVPKLKQEFIDMGYALNKG